MQAYLIMMASRLIELKRVLKPTGSIYLHCDPTASHYLKMLMDTLFGSRNFHNEIVWHYYNKYGRGTRVFGRNYDQILFYAFDNYTFNPQREKRDKPTKQLVRENVDGVLKNKRDENGKLMYRIAKDKKVDAVWRIPCLQPASKQYLGYPTQKHIALLDRIIKASSNPGDIVLDPFCGCATTLVAAHNLERQWIGIDISPKAVDLVQIRLKDAQRPMFSDVIARTDIPKRTDVGDTPNYRTQKHTLFGLQEGLCAGCNIHFPFRNMTIDHVVPQSKGGTDHIENLQLLCNACNNMKGIKTQAEFIVALKEAGLSS